MHSTGPSAGTPADAVQPPELRDQPLSVVERDGVRYTLLGTAHVSRASVAAVEAILSARRFDAVAVELCEPRFVAMTQPDAMHQMDLFSVVREGKTALVAANLALAAYQRRLAEQFGIDPGAEMRAAIAGAHDQQAALWRIDRDVGVTLKRAYRACGFWQRLGVVGGLLASAVVDESIDEEEIERLKQGDLLESTFSEFARRSQKLYAALIDERDRYMAAALRRHASATPVREVLVVIGAGHLAGLARYLAADDAEPEAVFETLSTSPPPGRLGTWLTVLLSLFVLGGFAYGFYIGDGLGTELVLNWVLVTGTLGAVGCALAGGHPLSILSAFVASPLTPLHPALASGTVSALVELWLRRPTVADFAALREDIGHLRGWWRNGVARVFLNFFLTSLGTAIGVYLAGYRMIGALV
ncbi:MAG TPA: TraB/GumN family protein [Xanthomonadaceae bacterium]|nr:TraB/GumN family protein [Xanthomonadaceae bacterium]